MQEARSFLIRNDRHYIWRLEVREDNPEGVNVMKTIHKVNAEFLNTRLWQMLILFKYSLQATAFTTHIYNKVQQVPNEWRTASIVYRTKPSRNLTYKGT